MIKKVETKMELKTFVHFVEKLYQNDPYHVNPLFFALTGELKQEVLVKKQYTALLCFKDKELKGRILYTIDDSKKQGKQVGYFSMLDFYEDIIRRVLT